MIAWFLTFIVIDSVDCLRKMSVMVDEDSKCDFFRCSEKRNCSQSHVYDCLIYVKKRKSNLPHIITRGFKLVYVEINIPNICDIFSSVLQS